MDKPTRLKENLKQLAKNMVTLKELKGNVARKKAEKMARWLKEVESNENQFEELRKKINELNNGGAFCLRDKLNKKLIELDRNVNVQNEVADAISDTTETLFRDLTEGKPQKFTHADLNRFKKGFFAKIDIHGNGTVCKGEFSSQVQIVVKVLTNKDIVETTFMGMGLSAMGDEHKLSEGFDLILAVAVQGKLSESDMVKKFSCSVTWSLIRLQRVLGRRIAKPFRGNSRRMVTARLWLRLCSGTCETRVLF